MVASERDLLPGFDERPCRLRAEAFHVARWSRRGPAHRVRPSGCEAAVDILQRRVSNGR